MTYDFAVIGGGIAGVSAAARLAPLGSVIVLEAEDALAYHASGRSAALYEPNYGAPTVVDLSLAGREFFETDSGGVLSPRGILMVCKPGEEDTFREESASFAMEEISVQDALKRVPIFDANRVVKAAFTPSAQDIDTDLLIQNFVRKLREAGGAVRTGLRITDIEKADTIWTLRADDDCVTARNVVNAGGAWADQVAVLAGMAPIGLQPMRRSVARIPAPNELDVTDWPMMFGVGEGWYAKPDAGQIIVSPSEEDPMDPFDAWADDMVIAGGLDRFSQVTNFEVSRVTSTWAGLRTFAPDRTLILGPDPADNSFIWAAGQGGYGFQTSAGASQLIADLVAGRASELSDKTVAALKPDRFR
ncbi:MAG: FAD-binding oxidoreductase [Pseudomonadota bacterium]